MAKIVNLNKARKSAVRAQKKRQADENAVKYGRTKAEKNLEKTQNTKVGRDLDRKKFDK